MNAIELAMPAKGTSWPDLILQVESLGIENGKAFPIEKETSVRPAISKDVKLRDPTRIYRANKQVKDGVIVLWVWRQA